MRRARALGAGLAALALALAAACRSPDALYRELGEQPGVEALVEALLTELAADARVVEKFRDTDIRRLRRMLVEHLCAQSGGPCRYSGDSMADAHAGLDISHAQFNALVEDLIRAMETLRLPLRTQNRLLAVLAPLRPEIVRR